MNSFWEGFEKRAAIYSTVVPLKTPEAKEQYKKDSQETGRTAGGVIGGGAGGIVGLLAAGSKINPLIGALAGVGLGALAGGTAGHFLGKAHAEKDIGGNMGSYHNRGLAGAVLKQRQYESLGGENDKADVIKSSLFSQKRI